MTPFVETVTGFLSIGAIVLDFAVVALLVAIIFFRKSPSVRPMLVWIARHTLVFGLITSGAAVFASLFYSNIAGFTPCGLCWWQRVFIYPQVVLFGVALYRRTKGWEKTDVYLESMILSIVGGAIALYNYYGQSFNQSILACSEAVVSCSKLYFNAFGFVTLPFMSLALYAALIALGINHALMLRELTAKK